MKLGPASSEISPARLAAFEALTGPSVGDPADEDFFGPPPVFERLERNDRALAERIYRGVLQNLRLLDYLLHHSETFRPTKTPMNLRWLLRMAVYQRIFLSRVPDYAIVQQTVEQGRRVGGEKASRFMNGVLRRLMRELPGSEAEVENLLTAESETSPALRFSVPGEIARAYAEAYGEQHIEALLRAANEEESPVWLRVNRLKTDAQSLREDLLAEGVETTPVDGFDGALLWSPGSRKPWDSAAWERGELTVQDLGAMLAVEILKPRAGERVIDWCAAPGGKTGQIWETMEGRGELFAYEPNPQRCDVLATAMSRLYGTPRELTILRQVETGGERELFPPPASAVLVDAPCLGLGLIRRHPEIRWDNRLQQAHRIERIQTGILETASKYVESGGRMLWVTCSPTRDEIENRIEKWLPAHPDFRLADIEARVPDWARAWTMAKGPFLRTRPDRARVDGFGMALLERG